MVKRDVQRNLRKPVIERRAAVVLVQEPPCFDERFLGEVLDLLEIAFVTVQDGKHLVLVASDDFGEIVRGSISDSLQ